jgi:hypothetical protein
MLFKANPPEREWTVIHSSICLARRVDESIADGS